MDKIQVRNLRLHAFHGVNPEEKVLGQLFVLDLDAEIDLEKACMTDRIEDTVSYAKIIKTARRVFSAQTDNLLERAAQRVADALLAEFSPIDSIRIVLKKPHAPIQADFDWVGIEIVRRRMEKKLLS